MIRNNLQEQQFNTWFAPIHSVTFNEERRELTLCVPSPFIYEYIEKHFIKLLSAVLKHIYGAGVSLIYKVTTDATNGISMNLEGGTIGSAKPQNAVDVIKTPRIVQDFDSQLHPQYTFDWPSHRIRSRRPSTRSSSMAAPALARHTWSMPSAYV